MSPTNAQKVSIYDTTLRDGNQARGISLSLADKLQLTRLFDEFGVDYIEGGWPNPTSTLDQEYFRAVASLPLTRKSRRSAPRAARATPAPTTPRCAPSSTAAPAC